MPVRHSAGAGDDRQGLNADPAESRWRHVQWVVFAPAHWRRSAPARSTRHVLHATFCTAGSARQVLHGRFCRERAAGHVLHGTQL